jgi:hypothetical protein
MLTSGQRRGRLAGGGRGGGTAEGGWLTKMGCGWVELRRIEHQRAEDAGSTWVGDEGGSDQGGSRLGRCHVLAQAHSVVWELTKDFQTKATSNDQKLVLCCS